MSENTTAEISFEQAISELEKLVSEIENGSLPLEKMIDHIERGAKLIKLCQGKLNVMNSKVELLFKDDGNAGEFREFDTSSERSRAAAQAATVSANQDDLPF